MGMNVKASSGGGDEGEMGPVAEINVTPLVDVMLVLLIIFMVTAPLMITQLPSRARQAPRSADPVVRSGGQLLSRYRRWPHRAAGLRRFAGKAG